jgi:hypothetical protein
MKTVVALYDHLNMAERAVQDLQSAGFSRDSISLIANDAGAHYSETIRGAHHDDDVKADEGAGFGAVVGTLVGLAVALIPGIGPVIAVGPFATALLAGIGAAAGAVTGGVVAGLVDLGVDEEDAHHYAEGLRRGGTLVSVSASDEQANRAEEILNRHQPIDIDHRGSAWRESGWTTFDGSAPQYTQEEVTRERQMYMSSAADVGMNNDIMNDDVRAFRNFGTEASVNRDMGASSSGSAGYDTDSNTSGSSDYPTSGARTDAGSAMSSSDSAMNYGNQRTSELGSDMGYAFEEEHEDGSQTFGDARDHAFEDDVDNMRNRQNYTTFGMTGTNTGRRGARTYSNED